MGDDDDAQNANPCADILIGVREAKNELHYILRHKKCNIEFKQYNLMIDKNGLLLIGGRVRITQQTLSNYYAPILLHRDSALAKALLDDASNRKLKDYGGPNLLATVVPGQQAQALRGTQLASH